MTNFSGLYYPGESWNLDIEDSMLKKSLLFFDKIYAIVPEVFSVDWKSVQPYEELDPFLLDVRRYKQDDQLRVRQAIEAEQLSSEQQEPVLPEIERHGRIQRFLDKVDMLRKEGVLELVDPRENLTEPSYWETETGPYPWLKIQQHYQASVQQHLSKEKLEYHKPPILYGGILSDLNDLEFREIASNLGSNRVVLYKGQAEVNWLSFLGEASGIPEDKWQHISAGGVFCGSWAGTVSTAMWAAFVINHTLLTAHKYDLIPVTPNEIFWELLQSKVRRLRNFTEIDLKDKFWDHPEYKTGFSGFSLAAFTLPNLEVMSFEDVLELRLALEEELIAFREHMAILAERIRAEPWEPSFIKEIERITKSDIQPAVQRLQRRLGSLPTEVVQKSFKRLVSVPTGLSVLATIWAGLPPLLVMAVAAGLISIESALSYHFEHEKILQSNGLSLLLKLS